MHVRIGILSNKRYPGTGIPVAEVAAKNEFGAPGVPARPFMRNTISAKKSAWSSILVDSIKAGYSKEKALQSVGIAAVADIKETIEKSALVKTGLMRDSIQYELE